MLDNNPLKNCINIIPPASKKFHNSILKKTHAPNHKQRNTSVSRNKTPEPNHNLENCPKNGNVVERLLKYEDTKDEKLSALRMNIVLSENKKCTHTPKINNNKKNDKNIVERSDEILYNRNEKLRKKREEMKAEKENVEISACTFKPNINKKSNRTLIKSKRDVTDQLAWQKQKDDKLLESLFERSKKEQESTTFAPTISDNSKKIADCKLQGSKAKPVQDRLYDVKRCSTPKPNTSARSHKNTPGTLEDTKNRSFSSRQTNTHKNCMSKSRSNNIGNNSNSRHMDSAESSIKDGHQNFQATDNGRILMSSYDNNYVMEKKANSNDNSEIEISYHFENSQQNSSVVYKQNYITCEDKTEKREAVKEFVYKLNKDEFQNYCEEEEGIGQENYGGVIDSKAAYGEYSKRRISPESKGNYGSELKALELSSNNDLKNYLKYENKVGRNSNKNGGQLLPKGGNKKRHSSMANLIEVNLKDKQDFELNYEMDNDKGYNTNNYANEDKQAEFETGTCNEIIQGHEEEPEIIITGDSKYGKSNTNSNNMKRRSDASRQSPRNTQQKVQKNGLKRNTSVTSVKSNSSFAKSPIHSLNKQFQSNLPPKSTSNTLNVPGVVHSTRTTTTIVQKSSINISAKFNKDKYFSSMSMTENQEFSDMEKIINNFKENNPISNLEENIIQKSTFTANTKERTPNHSQRKQTANPAAIGRSRNYQNDSNQKNGRSTSRSKSNINATINQLYNNSSVKKTPKNGRSGSINRDKSSHKNSGVFDKSQSKNSNNKNLVLGNMVLKPLEDGRGGEVYYLDIEQDDCEENARDKSTHLVKPNQKKSENTSTLPVKKTEIVQIQKEYETFNDMKYTSQDAGVKQSSHGVDNARNYLSFAPNSKSKETGFSTNNFESVATKKILENSGKLAQYDTEGSGIFGSRIGDSDNNFDRNYCTGGSSVNFAEFQDEETFEDNYDGLKDPIRNISEEINKIIKANIPKVEIVKKNRASLKRMEEANKCQIDDRQFMSIGGVKIYYGTNVVTEIIDHDLRKNFCKGM